MNDDLDELSSHQKYLNYWRNMLDKLIDKLKDGEWSQTIVRGPNPTGFCTDETNTALEAAEAIDFLYKKVKLLEKVEMYLKTTSPEQSGFYFIAGALGGVDQNDLPKELLICPAYGCDWSQIYTRTERTTGPEW